MWRRHGRAPKGPGEPLDRERRERDARAHGAPRRLRLRSRLGRRRRHPNRHARWLPAQGGQSRAGHHAAAGGRVRGGQHLLPQGPGRHCGVQGHRRVPDARPGPRAHRLAAAARRQLGARPDVVGERAALGDAAGVAEGGPVERRLQPRALSSPQARHQGRPRRAVPRGLLREQPLDLNDRVQGAADARAGVGLLQGPAVAGLCEPPGARALALLDQHLPVVGARTALPLPLPQRGDQHAARQQEHDALAGGGPRVAVLWRSTRRAQADLLGRHVGQRQLRRGR